MHALCVCSSLVCVCSFILCLCVCGCVRSGVCVLVRVLSQTGDVVLSGVERSSGFSLLQERNVSDRVFLSPPTH